MKEQALVSVIVPVYNMQDYLEKCILSVQNQTYADFELILVDDGSADDSAEICRRFADHDARIRLIRQPNGGLSAARNAGLEQATGKYIYFLDSDDYIEPNLLERTVSVLEKEQCDCCGFSAIKETTEGEELARVAFKPRELCITSEEERVTFLLKYALNYRIGWEAWGKVYRASVIQQNHLRFVSERTVFAEDQLFSFLFWLYAEKCVIIEDYLYHYVQRGNSLMGQSKKRNVLPQMHELARCAYQFAEKAGKTQITEQFGIFYYHFMEWQCRPYMAENGPEWVQTELKKCAADRFFADDRSVPELIRQYGALDGAVTVAVPLLSPSDGKRAELYVKQLCNQMLQKLDILVLCREGLQISADDVRVRQITVPSVQPETVLRTAFAEAYGEYLCFADTAHPLNVDILAWHSDVLKYNDCGALLLDGEATQFYDYYSPEARNAFRRMLPKNAFSQTRAMLRTDLLAKSGLAALPQLANYTADVLLSDHVLVFQKEKTEK